MTKQIVYQLCSNDPNNYGEVIFEPIIPWNCEQIEYRIISLNTFSNFLLTTTDDFIEFSTGKVNFTDKCDYDIDQLTSELNKLFVYVGIEVALTDSSVLQFSSSKLSSFIINDASHRVKLLLGLFDINFPIDCGMKWNAPSSPMTSYGNVLYLQSIQGNAMGTRLDQSSFTAPIIYRINSFIKPGLPLIMNKKQDKVIVNVDVGKRIKITLVDFRFQPIILKSPLFICLKIKPFKLMQPHT